MTIAATDPAVLDVVRRRGIQDVLHFTTNHGLVGVGSVGTVLSRDRLLEEHYLDHVAELNCADRLKDADWTDYISMSLTTVNDHMLGTSRRWHSDNPDLWWTVLRFSPEVLAHEDVHFVTTNNTYTSSLRRGTGADALEALFAPAVEWGHYGSVRHRKPSTPDNQPTDPQAEVLYPHQLSLVHLTGIYVPQEDLIDEVMTWQAFFPPFQSVPVEYRPEVFE